MRGAALLLLRRAAIAAAAIAPTSWEEEVEHLLHSFREGNDISSLIALIILIVLGIVAVFCLSALVTLLVNLWSLLRGHPRFAAGLVGALNGAVLALAVRYARATFADAPDPPVPGNALLALGVGGVVVGFVTMVQAWRLQYPAFKPPPDLR